MTELEKAIYENGCRLIPGVTHDVNEDQRHIGRYEFAKQVIEEDSAGLPKVCILDIGCGCGYGTEILSQVPRSVVYGVDNSAEAIRYALTYHYARNTFYRYCDIWEYVKLGGGCADYIVALEVIEHLENGFELLLQLKPKRKLIVSTPYNERKPIDGILGAHVLFNITEVSYSNLPVKQFYYAGLDGEIQEPPLSSPLTLICVLC